MFFRKNTVFESCVRFLTVRILEDCQRKGFISVIKNIFLPNYRFDSKIRRCTERFHNGRAALGGRDFGFDVSIITLKVGEIRKIESILIYPFVQSIDGCKWKFKWKRKVFDLCIGFPIVHMITQLSPSLIYHCFWTLYSQWPQVGFFIKGGPEGKCSLGLVAEFSVVKNFLIFLASRTLTARTLQKVLNLLVFVCIQTPQSWWRLNWDWSAELQGKTWYIYWNVDW